jgi:hypothetical protein
MLPFVEVRDSCGYRRVPHIVGAAASSATERMCLRVKLKRRRDGRMVGRAGELWITNVDDFDVDKPVGEPAAREM